MRSMWKKYGLGSLMVASGMFVGLTLATDVTEAKVTGVCSDCHTMHNSQNGATEKVIGSTTVPNTLQPLLLKGSCIGCHGMGGADKIKTMSGGSNIPQVLHSGGGNLTNGGDLAGGNFGYITGAKGTKSDTKGHNVIDLGEIDDNLTLPPGHHLPMVPSYLDRNNFTCAGTFGCHGDRSVVTMGGVFKDSFKAITGAHHANVDGEINTPTATYNSYRFLWGVKGFENQTNKWQNVSATSHNEYFGNSTPMDYTPDACLNCHESGRVRPINNTISGFCAGCHGNFHLINGVSFFDKGIGSTTTPFIRHPTDVKLVSGTGVSTEYASYTTFSTEAPVARQAVSGGPPSDDVTGDDIVMCLSCHGAHATDYPDMLRWDYSGMLAHTAPNSSGCFVCHTTKDNP